jgi:hypothetical protein
MSQTTTTLCYATRALHVAEASSTAATFAAQAALDSLKTTDYSILMRSVIGVLMRSGIVLRLDHIETAQAMGLTMQLDELVIFAVHHWQAVERRLETQPDRHHLPQEEYEFVADARRRFEAAEEALTLVCLQRQAHHHDGGGDPKARSLFSFYSFLSFCFFVFLFFVSPAFSESQS